MAVIGETMVTMLDIARRSKPDGSIDLNIIEQMSQTNAILDDIPWIECNDGTRHVYTQRTGLPTGTYRKFNEGVTPSKSQTRQGEDTCAMLEDYSEVDVGLVEINGNRASFRASEDAAFAEGLPQTFAYQSIYGDQETDPEKIDGLQKKFKTLSSTITDCGYNIVDCGGTGSDNMSMYLVVWSPKTVHGIYPKGTQGGLQSKDLGEQTKEESSTLRQVYRTHFKWYHGIAIPDWRYIVRFANIDLSDTKTAGATADTSADLALKMNWGMAKIPNFSAGTPVFYARREVVTALMIQLQNRINIGFKLEDFTGASGIIRKGTLTYQGIPIRIMDQLAINETRVT